MLDVCNVNRIEWETLGNILSTSGALPFLLQRVKLIVVQDLCEDNPIHNELEEDLWDICICTALTES